MFTVLNAEAGLSECARYDVCDPDFGPWMAVWIAGLVLAMLWLAVTFAATVDILTAPIGARRTLLWLVLVWILPLVGAVAWVRRPAGDI